jgi:hypothetical protein
MFPRFFGAGLLDDQSFIIHVKSVRTGSGPRGQGHLHAGDRVQGAAAGPGGPATSCTGSSPRWGGLPFLSQMSVSVPVVGRAGFPVPWVRTGSARVTAWPADKSGGRGGRRDAELQSTGLLTMGARQPTVLLLGCFPP